MTQRLIGGYPPGGTKYQSNGQAVAAPNDTRVVGFVGAPIVRTGQVQNIGSAIPSILATENPKRRTVTIRNIGAVDVYIGDELVTISSGYRLGSSDPGYLLEATAQIYGITPSGAAGIICYLEEVDV